MRIKLLTHCDLNYNEIGETSIPLMKDYCSKNRIDFDLHDKITSKHTDVYWNKISIILKSLSSYDWVMWCDADVLIYDIDFDWRNYLLKLENKNLLISSDFRGICLGLFFIRSCLWSFELLKTLEALGNIKNEKVGLYDRRNQREQDTLKVLMDFFENISSKIELIPESIVSNPKSPESGEGLFAHHFWANGNPQKIASEMKNSLLNRK
jgi:hypothetical protein